MNKAHTNINWQNSPSTATPLSAANLNAMDQSIDTIDDRVIVLDAGKANTDANLSGFTDDSTHRLVTDTQISTWNGKADASAIPTALSDLSDDTTHRVVTDTEKSTWNGKSVVLYSQTLSTGVEVGRITINGTEIILYAPQGGSGGGGDMLASTYDPNGDVANAGGIPSYVSTAITNAITNAIGGSY